MPKRSAEDKIEWYTKKLKRLKEQQQNRRRRVVIYSSDSDDRSENEEANHDTVSIVDDVSPIENEAPEQPGEAPAEAPTTQEEGNPTEIVPEIDADLLSALGDAAGEVPKYGEKIHPDLAQRWLTILRKGIVKESKETLIKEYVIPENCKLLKAPSLNAELSAAVSDLARARDKRIEGVQQQLGVGITALNRAMTILLTSEDKQNKVKAIKILSDGCRILTDLHYTETQARIKLITPGLDKAFLNIMQDLESDETLFGSKLSEKIKASKAIEKQGWQIKKGVVTTRTSTANSTASQSVAPTRPRYQGNWTGPPRFQSWNRGGRGGHLRSTPAARRAAPPALAQTKTAGYNKQRAPPRQ